MNDKRRDKPPRPNGGGKRSTSTGGPRQLPPGAKRSASRGREDATGDRQEGAPPKRPYRAGQTKTARPAPSFGGGKGRKPRGDPARPQQSFRGGEDRRPRRDAAEPSSGGGKPYKPRRDAARPSPGFDGRSKDGETRRGAARPSPSFGGDKDREPRREAARPGRSFGGGKDHKPRRGAASPPAPQQPRTVDRSDDEARIAKVIARAGLCSRRDAEAWIAAGRVAVNGQVLASPALNVSPEDKITIDGQPLAAREPTRLFLFHKPRGYVTTDRDPEGRPTIFSLLSKELPRLVTIGRLDINTEGLLLLTNDGGLARVLELPATGWLRRYRVRARGETDQAALDALRDGVTVQDVHYAGIEAHLDRQQGANTWLTMGLREGKNREIKRVLETLGLEVNRLIRLSFGPFQLGNLAEGAVEEVKTRVLRDQLGNELAREAGVDFNDLGMAPIVTQEVRRQHRAERLERETREGGRRTRESTRERGGARGDRPPRRGAPQAEQREVRPRQDRPKAGPRKHVSVLRAQQDESRPGGRQRIERAETADRKGRAVKVERVVKAQGAPAREGAPSRNARRFAHERAEAAGAPYEQRRATPSPARKGAAGGERPLRRRTPDRAGGSGGRQTARDKGAPPPHGKR